jgi:hypothetical protein
VVKTDGAVADFPAIHAAPHVHNRSGNLVSKNLGRGYEAVLYLFQVGPANTAGRHANQYLAVGNLRHGNVFRGHAARAEIHTRAHFSATLMGRHCRIYDGG